VTKEEFPGLSAKPGAQYFAAVINAQSRLISVEDPDESRPYSQRIFALPGKALKLEVATAPSAPVGPGELEGDPATSTGVTALEGIDDVTMVCVPDLMSVTDDPAMIASVQQAVESFCIKGKRMAIHDAPPALDKQEIAEWRKAMTAVSPFSTLYWPWIKVADPVSGAVIEVPPCGHVAGVWAETDSRRGVHKAPANEVIRGTVGVATAIGNADQESMNTAGINVIRQFAGRGIRIWGARTLATQTEPEWRYINVRRLLNYVSASILQGTSWAVFEPNDELLWGQLRVSVGNFLMGTWRSGALFGSSPDEAFFVKCDRDTNPPDTVDAGQVNIYIGIAPVKPAEFVVFQISQYQPAAS
jgi:phage tail sheath protein FI